jgi:hypothetical protein
MGPNNGSGGTFTTSSGVTMGGGNGGNGNVTGSGGGGGAALGPAIFVNLGILITENSNAGGSSATAGTAGGGNASAGSADSTPVFNYGGTVNGDATTTGPITGALADSTILPYFVVDLNTDNDSVDTNTSDANYNLPGLGPGEPGDLRWAIQQAMAAGGGNIAFDCGSPCTITLNNPLPPIEAGSGITIDGDAYGDVVIDGNSGSGAANRVFFADTGTLTLNNLLIQNALAKGGNGADGGGGGMGAGACLFVNKTTVNVNNSNFVNCQAIGGAGGSINDIDNTDNNGGGGGGMAFNGGGGGGGGNESSGGGGGGMLSAGAAGSADTASTGGSGGGSGGGGGGGGIYDNVVIAAIPQCYTDSTTGGAGYGLNPAGSPATASCNGGDGSFGGGGGGASYFSHGDGGNGGVGGGGGGAGCPDCSDSESGSGGHGHIVDVYDISGKGGNGGFGGGGGTGSALSANREGFGGYLTAGGVTYGGGNGDTAVGTGDAGGGGGGAALGPAIFVNTGILNISNSGASGAASTAGAGGGGNATAGSADATPVFNYGGTVNGATTQGPLSGALCAYPPSTGTLAGFAFSNPFNLKAVSAPGITANATSSRPAGETAAFTLYALDSNNNVDIAFGGTVNLNATSGSGTGFAANPLTLSCGVAASSFVMENAGGPYTVTASDASGSGVSVNSNPITVTSDSYVPLTATQKVASTALTQNKQATPFTPVTGSGGTGTASYSVSPTLPAGLSMDSINGRILGTPTVASGTITYTVTVTDQNNATATATFNLTVNSAVTATQQVRSIALTQNHPAIPFTPLTGAGGTGTLSYSVSPTLPAGLSLSTTSGQITGTPTATSGGASYFVTVTDANGATATNTFSLTVNGAVIATQAIASTSLTQNQQAAAFTPVTGGGGTTPLSFSVLPSLPSGLSMNSGNGRITGTPTATSSAASYTVTVSDANGATASASFSLTVLPPAPTVTGISPASGPAKGGTSVTLTGTNFTGATAVNFGATSAASFVVKSATQIAATAPAGSAGAVSVTVVTAGGTSATGSGNQFTYTAASLSVAATHSSPIFQGGPGLLTLTVANSTGIATLGAATVTDIVDPSLTINSVSSGCSVSVSGQKVTCTIPAGSTAASTSFNIYVTASASAAASISNTPSLTDNSDTVTTSSVADSIPIAAQAPQVDPQLAQISLSGSTDGGNCVTGNNNTLTATIQIQNSGGMLTNPYASNVTLSGGNTLISQSASPLSVAEGGTVTFTFHIQLATCNRFILSFDVNSN